ncbi:pirin family protein [Nannocystis pusilla]|uniref:Pirin family protein n=1 Tax=Nannocystis pusilla TaxID=889268 RepID=A0ABS7TZU7_9BACT|nr:pirin family protein [Nannocystis pusilla]MBZ5713612.1 pirin family protein [Nannocystis pusilla]
MDTTITSSTLHGPELAARARRVESVHRGGPMHWVGDGFHVRGVFPGRSLPMERTSPFLLLDHHPRQVYPALTQGRRGVGWHPHRGFETVTLAWEGTVAHRDTAGHSGIIGPGDVQWMTAASGILHEEYHEQEFSRRGGPVRLLQLWVNLPARLKMSEPGYQPITAAQIPTVALDEDAGQVRVIAGEFAGARGPARTHTPISLLDVELRAKGRLVVPLPQDHNALVLVESGHAKAGSEHGRDGELFVFENDGAFVELVAKEDSHLVVLAGEPIDEPIASYGPFVMNTRVEIAAAVRDFEAGKFGAVPK